MAVNLWMYLFATACYITWTLILNCCNKTAKTARILRCLAWFVGIYETLFAIYGISECWADRELQFAWDNRLKTYDIKCDTELTWSNCYPKYW